MRHLMYFCLALIPFLFTNCAAGKFDCTPIIDQKGWVQLTGSNLPKNPEKYEYKVGEPLSLLSASGDTIFISSSITGVFLGFLKTDQYKFAFGKDDDFLVYGKDPKNSCAGAHLYVKDAKTNMVIYESGQNCFVLEGGQTIFFKPLGRLIVEPGRKPKN